MIESQAAENALDFFEQECQQNGMDEADLCDALSELIEQAQARRAELAATYR